MTATTILHRLGRVVMLWGCLGSAAWAAAPAPMGDYASARTPDDEFVRLTLAPKGKAIIIAEHNFQVPGDASRRRGRTTTYGKWSRKGDVVTLTYAKLTDRLRYEAAAPLDRIGLPGKAAALTPMKPLNANGRLKGMTLWRAPHDYRLPQAEAGGAPSQPPVK